MKTTLLISAIASLALAASAPAASATTCTGAADVPTGGANSSATATTVCLINQVRSSAHLRPLRINRQLTAAAKGWSNRLVAGRFFSHVDPSGGTLDSRARASGYTRSALIWGLGENLAWGAGATSTPDWVVKAWLGSPGHRANLLEPSWRDVGVGIADGTPVGSGGATYAVEFGTRTLAAKQCRKVLKRFATDHRLHRVCAR